MSDFPVKPSPGTIYQQLNALVKEAEDEKQADESDIVEFLADPDNILIAYGQKIIGHSRQEIADLSKDVNNVYIDENKNKYIQIVGRHLIPFKELKMFQNMNYSIFNVSTLLNVILVTNISTGARQKRSYYELKSFRKEDLQGLKLESNE
jgi:hypothetical protein